MGLDNLPYASLSPSHDADSVNNELDVPSYPIPTDDPSIRTNALYFQGTPLTELPTGKIFTYISSFSSSVPLGIEWIADDRELFPSLLRSRTLRVSLSLNFPAR